MVTKEEIMYTGMLIPLDGSKTAEKVLPYARYLAGRLDTPVELLAVIDIAELAAQVSPEKARFLDTVINDGERQSKAYLSKIAATFPGRRIKCTIDKGSAGDTIIGRGEADTGMLIAMGTHGRSGMNRWLLGSVAEKVLRGTTNPLLLVRATDEAKSEGEAILKSVVVPLDGSEIAASVLPMVAGLGKNLGLEVELFRAFNIPYSVYGTGDGYYGVNVEELIAEVGNEAREYLEKKSAELKHLGVAKVTCTTKEGFAADEIISLSRKTPDNFIAMCSHGRSGVKRWALGSVTETVVRHTEDPVLILRPG
jgi:nucleotide-binding universal stress UspA family protein